MPVDNRAKQIFEKMTDHYKEFDKTFKISIEDSNKEINVNQKGLYRAFVNSAADYFGNEYHEMEKLLDSFKPNKSFHLPDGKIPVENWSTSQLDDFINKATAHLAQFGFKF